MYKYFASTNLTNYWGELSSAPADFLMPTDLSHSCLLLAVLAITGAKIGDNAYPMSLLNAGLMFFIQIDSLTFFGQK